MSRLVFGCQYGPEITKKFLAVLINGPMREKEKATGLVRQGHSVKPKQNREQTWGKEGGRERTRTGRHTGSEAAGPAVGLIMGPRH